MSLRQIPTFMVSLSILVATSVSAQRVVPSALLTIDQNRATVVDRIVGQWGDRLMSSNAGISAVQLREILSGLRADHLLAASLAGSVEGLRDVVSGALVHTDAAVSPGLMHAKSLGDTGDDLVYTPIVPCRILDTRNGTVPPYNAQMVGGSAFPVAANLANFAPQGGSATNCTLPSSFAAIAMTLTVLNPNFDAFLAASSSSNFATLTQSVVMDFSANKGLANTAIVPVDGTVKFYLGLPAQVTTHVIADAVGYLRRPTNYGGTHVITGINATDSGGYGNTASGSVSTVAGGSTNTASGVASTVTGGTINTASGSWGTVGGGYTNAASSDYSTVGGGVFNTASGSASTVPGGDSNTAFGSSSFAAGYHAYANYDGCFVWGDSTTTNPVQCDAPNRFVVRAEGGIFMFAGNDGTNAQTHYTGVGLAPGSQAWTAQSDRAGKDNLRPVDPKQVLRKVAAIPIATWNWKSQDTSIRHMGPMAQDFHAAFGLGETPKGISTIDADGVALAAIQGLHQLLREKDRRIARLESQAARVETLERRLRAIESRVESR